MNKGSTAVVTGMGAVSSAGLGVADNWASVLRGRSTAARHPVLAGLPVDFACGVPEFDADEAFGARRSRVLDRHVQLALLAAREAVANAGLGSESWDATRVAVVLGTAVAGTATAEEQQTRLLNQGAQKVSPQTLPMMLSNMAAAQVAIDLEARGPALSVSTACATGATAIAVARDLLRSGAADIVVAGATDAAITPLYSSAFNRMRALSRAGVDPAAASKPFDRNRDGFVLGEGAAVLVMETERHARGRGAQALAAVRGYGATCDAHHVTAPDPTGDGAERAVRAALADAGVNAHEVGYINAHGTSTPLNDAVEASVVQRVIGTGAAVSSTKGVTGHALGAAGALEAVYSILALRHGQLPPTANLREPEPGVELDLVRDAPRDRKVEVALSNSFGFGGHNAVLLFTTG